jgi:tight adherence protein B
MVVVMRSLAIGLLGAACGVGLLSVIAGLRGHRVLGTTSNAVPSGSAAARGATMFDQLLLRITLALGSAFVVWFITGWPVAAMLAALAAWSAPTAWRARGRHADEVKKVKAIGYESFSASLRLFADDLDHPLGDFVTAALVTAAEKQARDIAQLLGHLAECARDEAKMRTRVWVGRARTRTASRVMVGTIFGFLAFMFLTNRAYLDPYGSAGGQVVLGIIGAVFAAAFAAMDRMGRIALPERFIGRRAGHSATSPAGAIGAPR